jgi:diguanylate cyclase (GGDEF)-like protein
MPLHAILFLRRSKGRQMVESGREKPVVLVADDEEDIRNLVRVNLMNDYEVIGAANGRECLEMARDHSPDVILLDIMMPAMDGRQVLVELSERAATRNIPVIFLSALTRPEDRVTGLESGAIDYITKPADPREIAARVGAALRRRGPIEQPPSELDLPDAEAFEQRIAEEIARASRHRTPLSILLIEIDEGEKEIPERSILDIADLLKSTLRLSDILFACGPRSFGALLPDTDSATAFLAGERNRIAVLGARHIEGDLTVSIGIAEHSGTQTEEDLIGKADVALYRAKDSGGNRCWRADDPRRHGLSPRSLSEELTEREWDILAHLVKRKTEPEIARQLGITTGTVRSHKARIRRKLQIAPNVRLSEFARANLTDLVEHLNRSSV